MITDEDKERVRQAIDFVTLVSETVELKPRGQDYWGCCPFHQEKSPRHSGSKGLKVFFRESL